jgi:signal transduction histidine kinase
LGKSSLLLSVVLLNATNEAIASAGMPIDLTQNDITQNGERWGPKSVTLVNPVDLGASLSSEGSTNPTVVVPPFTNSPGRNLPRRSAAVDRVEATNEVVATSNAPALAAVETNGGGVLPRAEVRSAGGSRPRRPPWLRGMSDVEWASLMEQRSLHGLVLAMSTEAMREANTRDLWLRSIIILLATVSVIGSGLAWRNLVYSSDLQLRLVRASELNSHLKEMNLAAAGLAHETRNPLNIIRGRAQMISRQPGAHPETEEKAREIIEEADKVAAQLNEFINYSRPRQVRRTTLPLTGAVNEVARALSYDLEEKKIRLEIKGEALRIEADEQLLRQALFNLILNAIQAANGNGEIQVVAERRGVSEASLEVRDNGPGVLAENRRDIFKPYFTTQKQGTGLGLAVVQQIVLAHGWEIECLPNSPQGAIFRITHLKLAGG